MPAASRTEIRYRGADGAGEAAHDGWLSLYRPRSIARLILIGLGVTLTPVIAAVITAVVSVDRLAEDYRATVLEAEIATQQSRTLIERLTEMQRALEQYRILGEQRFHDTYLEHRRAFRSAADDLTELELTETANADLAELLREEQALFERIGAEPGDAVDSPASAEWSALRGRAQGVLTASSNLITDQANLALRAADELQRNLLLQAAAVIPASLILGGLFVVSITRPMRGLSSAIRKLGAHDLSDPIRIRGPRDIEDLGQQLDWLRQRINELEHQKITFLRHISHELKTPLTTLREGSELLAESLASSSPEEAEISRLMQSNSLRLQKLIEDLLQFGRTQQLVSNLDIEPDIRLDWIIEEIVASQSVAAGAKQIEIETELESARAAVDTGKLRIVVDNLLTNAIKYTPAGGTIRIELRREDQSVRLDVEDTGPGIDASEQQSIFEPFVQGSALYQSSVKGTGLGLAIAKDYVESHNGKIEVVPSESGAHFRVTLPLPEPDAEAALA